MGGMFPALMNSMEFVVFNRVLSMVLFVVFVVYFFSKEGRDERGRAIVGTACLYAFASLAVSINVYGYFTYSIMSNPAVFTNAFCLVFLVFEIVLLASVAVLRKLR